MVVHLQPAVVVDAVLVSALGPYVTRRRVVICLRMHGVEPMGGRDDADGKVCHGRRLANHDVLAVANRNTLT